MLQMDGYYAVGYTDGSPLRLCTARMHNSSDGCVGGWVVYNYSLGSLAVLTWGRVGVMMVVGYGRCGGVAD